MILSVLNLLDITWKFCSVAVFVIIDLQALFCTEFIGVLMTCLHIRFHTSGFSCSLVIIKPKAKYWYRFHAAAMLFYIMQKKYPVRKAAYFVKICYCASFQDPKLSFPPQVSVSTVLLLTIVLRLKFMRLRSLSWI